MKNLHRKTRFRPAIILAVLLLGVLSLQSPMMSYSMDDCETEMMCGACGCVADTPTGTVSSHYSELGPLEEIPTPKPFFLQEPRIHPPR